MSEPGSLSHERPARRRMSAYLRLTIVRHGQTDWTPAPEEVCVADPGLTEFGHRQAQALARRLAGTRFDVMAVSSLRRARETAGPIAAATGLSPMICDWLPELGVELAGKSRAELATFYQDARFRPPLDWVNGFHPGESFADFRARVTNGLDLFLAGFGVHREMHDGHAVWQVRGGEEGDGAEADTTAAPGHGLPSQSTHVLIVAHGGTNGLIVTHLLGVDPVPWEWERFAMPLASITELHTVPLFQGAIWSLDTFADRHHLRDLANTSPGPLDIERKADGS